MAPKSPLSIRLAESVVFLRVSSETTHSRRRYDSTQSPPAMLRGLLTLHLTKPTRISSIEIELQGKSVIQWPEGTAHRRIDIPEECNFLSARTVFFCAKSCPSSTRSTSLGPGTRRSEEEDDVFYYDHSHPRTARSSPRSPPRPSFDPSSLHPSLQAERRNSTDGIRSQPDLLVHNSVPTLSPDHLVTPPVSPPYTPTPAFAELPVISRPQTPTEPRPGSSHHRARSIKTEENPGQMLEEFRNALRVEMGSTRRPGASRNSSSSVPQTAETNADSSESNQISFTTTPPRTESAPGSRTSSRDTEFRQPRPASTSIHRPAPYHRRTTSPSPTPSPSTPPAFLRSLHHLPAHTSYDPDDDHSRDKRTSSRWSLSGMSSVLKDAKDRIRSGSKDTELRRGRTPERRPVGGSEHHVDFTVIRDEEEGKRREKERKGALGKLTAAVGLDEPSHAESWKEFRKGTYTYPISFAIPSTSPPTVHCDFGTIIYRLKAVVHRPGTLTTKLVATREVTLVATSADDDTEETHSIVVERQWDDQLRYLIALSGRSFVIGSQVPFNLTMVPMEKCKVYRLSIFLEEKTEYHTRHRQITREQPIKRFELLSIRHQEKNSPPILPISPKSASLLMPYLDTSSLSSTVDEALSSLMGPGPWILSHDLQLPTECGKIHFTYKHKGVNITVSHVLKIVFRVERGDDQCLDPKTGKRRLFDIVVQTPIHILSCHCKSEWTSLPRYSLFEAGYTDHSLTTSGPTCACSGGSAPLLSTFSGQHSSPAVTPSNSRPATAERRPSGNAPAFGSSDVYPTPAHPPAHLADSSYQFARLISGQEGVLGDVPPRYQEVLAHDP